MKIAIQGAHGAYSHLASIAVRPEAAIVPCALVKDALDALRDMRVDFALLPVENRIAGRVEDVHNLLPDYDVTIIAEHFQPIQHHLLALPGVSLAQIKFAHSHIQALRQCSDFLAQHHIAMAPQEDTAASAAALAARPDQTVGVVASSLAGKLYGLDSLAADIANTIGNITRFWLLGRNANIDSDADLRDGQPFITTMLCWINDTQVNAVTRILSLFEEYGVAFTRLETAMTDGRFRPNFLSIDMLGHHQHASVAQLIAVMRTHHCDVRILGAYPAHAYRNL